MIKKQNIIHGDLFNASVLLQIIKYKPIKLCIYMKFSLSYKDSALLNDNFHNASADILQLHSI